MTPLFGARHPIIQAPMAYVAPPLPYPAQRAVAAARGPLYMSGTNATNARELPVAELVETLVAEAA